MQTLNEYMQSTVFSDNTEEMINILKDLKVPDDLKTKFIQIINDNEFEIAEYQYERLVSDYEDYEHERHKEEKYFKE